VVLGSGFVDLSVFAIELFPLSEMKSDPHF